MLGIVIPDQQHDCLASAIFCRLNFFDLSLISTFHSGDAKEYAKEKFLQALWNKIRSVIENSLRRLGTGFPILHRYSSIGHSLDVTHDDLCHHPVLIPVDQSSAIPVVCDVAHSATGCALQVGNIREEMKGDGVLASYPYYVSTYFNV
jgi:hypothetical protein